MSKLTLEDKAIELMTIYPCGIKVSELIKGSRDFDPIEVLKEMVRISEFEREI